MNNRIVHCLPGDENFHEFDTFPKQLYPKEILERNHLHQTVKQHLAQCFLLFNDEQPVARAAVYINPSLVYEGKSTACIGSYECVDDEKHSRYLLDYIKNWVQKKNISWLIGPMEGSTWNSYRFSHHNRYDNFFMEPYHHIYYNKHFKNAGFCAIANYRSNLDETLNYDEEKLIKFEKYYIEKGAIFRHLNMNDFENDLHKIAEFTIVAFAKNLLYTPIQPIEFVNKYKPLKPLFDPRLVWIVEDKAGEIQALLFAIRDHLDFSGETLIIKSMANTFDTPFRGISTYLARKTIHVAQKMGFTKIIHALMISHNNSLKASEKYAQGYFKSYTLYAFKCSSAYL